MKSIVVLFCNYLVLFISVVWSFAMLISKSRKDASPTEKDLERKFNLIIQKCLKEHTESKGDNYVVLQSFDQISVMNEPC